jgi:hypothetical protein
MTYRYGSARTSTLQAKLEGIPFGRKPGDSPEWKACFDNLNRKFNALYRDGKITNEMFTRIWRSWNAQMTYQEIVGILQPAYDNIIANQAGL